MFQAPEAALEAAKQVSGQDILRPWENIIIIAFEIIINIVHQSEH